MALHFTERKLEELIEESVRKALREEIMKLRALAVPGVSRAEQKDIEKRYGEKPSRKIAKSYSVEI